jgi:hypothetical protein
MDIPVVAPVTPEVVDNQSSRKPSLTRRTLIGIIGVLIILALCIAGFFYVKNSAGGLYGVKVFEGTYASGKVLEFGLLGLKEERLAVSGVLNDYAEYGNIKVAIVTDAETKAQDVFLLGPKNKKLTEDGIGKVAVSVSSDGKYIAYAQRADRAVGGEFSPQISSWSIIVTEITTGTQMDLGQGFAPQFYKSSDGSTRVLYTTRTGVSSVDLATRAVRSIDFLNPGIIDFSATVSRDGQYLAVPNGVSKVFEIFRLTDTNTEFSVALVNIGPSPSVHGALTGNRLVGVSRTDDGTASLWTAGYSPEDKKITPFTLPANSHYRVVR